MPIETEPRPQLESARSATIAPGDRMRSSSDQVNILLVDDRPDNLLALEVILADLGQNLIKATSGREALRHLLQQDFALILLDVSMPGLDGFETAALMRGRLRSEHTPIIFVTAHSDTDNHIARGYSLGAVDFISSPVVPTVLKAKVGVFVELYKKTQQIQRQAERLLRLEQAEQKRRLSLILEAYPDIVFVLGSGRKIEFTNPAAVEFTRALDIKDRLPSVLQAEVERVLETGENHLPTTFEGVHRFRIASAERYFLPRMVRLGSDAKTLMGVAVMLQDVTEFRLLDEVKSNLIGTVSHELKTPLTSIRTALLLLSQQAPGALDPKQAELVAIATEESERVLRTLGALLDLTRFEGGLPGMHLETVAPEDLIRAAVAQMRTAATAVPVTIILTVDRDLPLVRVDRERIILALTNLLTNAIKYSPENARIEVDARREAQGIRFSVADEGEGIPEEYHARIFEKFFRVPGGTKNGAGLGLTIAREFVKAHGGTIGVRGRSGRGVEFYIVLKEAAPGPT